MAADAMRALGSRLACAIARGRPCVGTKRFLCNSILRTRVVCLHQYQLADGRACCAQALPVVTGGRMAHPARDGREKRWQDVPDNLSSENGVNDSSAAAIAVRELLEGVRQGEPLQAGALTLIPLVAASEQVKRQTGYLPLEEALRRKLV